MLSINGIRTHVSYILRSLAIWLSNTIRVPSCLILQEWELAILGFSADQFTTPLVSFAKPLTNIGVLKIEPPIQETCVVREIVAKPRIDLNVASSYLCRLFYDSLSPYFYYSTETEVTTGKCPQPNDHSALCSKNL